MLTCVPTAQARTKAGPWFWGAALSCLVLFFWLCTVLFPVLFFFPAPRAFLEILYRDLIKRSCQEISYRDLYGDLAKRSLTEILPTELL